MSNIASMFVYALVNTGSAKGNKELEEFSCSMHDYFKELQKDRTLVLEL